jgi:WD40 repeat protein
MRPRAPEAILRVGVATHQLGRSLTGHARPVMSVAFSPDGQTLATGSADHTVRLWDVATRRQIGHPLTGHTDAVTSVAFSPDGKTLATGEFDGIARLWDVSYAGNLRSYLCASAGRSLTHAEWKQYVPPGFEYQQLCP